MKIKTTMLFPLFTVLFSCKKDNSPVLTTDLTGCPINSTCSYNYYDNADLSANQPVAGQYRAFVYKSVNANMCAATTSLYFKSALSNTEFVINSDQIAAGQIVGYDLVCPCCDNYEGPFKPIGGQIKGKRTDATHWLINASIIFGTSLNIPLDTLTVNQYFSLKTLP